MRNPVKDTSWWGVFIIRDTKPQIVAKTNYHFSNEIDFALQAGPRLIVDGDIPKLKESVNERSALGITRSGKVLIVVTQNAEISLQDLAEIMRKSEQDDGLNAVQALNLDGGSSSQLYAQIGDFYLNIPSISAITRCFVILIIIIRAKF